MSTAQDIPVPFLDLSAEFRRLQAPWQTAIGEIGGQGAIILGPNVRAFEAEAAAWIGVKHAVSVANGTDALVLSLRALGIGPGDEVITTPFTFFATAEAVSLVGATPVFADIDAASFNLDPASVESRVTPRTRAILPVHLFGRPAPMGELAEIARQHGLSLIEDGAQAFGAEVDGKKAGSLGAAGCFSFYPTKVLGCYGDGGMITTNHGGVAEHLWRLRNHGAVSPFIHTELGTNSRLAEVQAALLRLKLKEVDAAIAGRRRVAAEYGRLLANTEVITPADAIGGMHAYNLYTIRSPRRDALRAHLTEHEVATSLCYPRPLHLQEVYTGLGHRPGDLPVAEGLCAEVLSLPIYPDLSQEQIERVCGLIREF